jgi:hypothetical protein
MFVEIKKTHRIFRLALLELHGSMVSMQDAIFEPNPFVGDELFMLVHEVDGKRIALLYDNETNEGILEVTVLAHDLELPSKSGNGVQISADLRCEIGYGPAVEMLLKGRIPFEHPLWHLNHDGPPKNASLN